MRDAQRDSNNPASETATLETKAMKNTDTIYDDNGTTRFIFRHTGGAFNGSTSLSVDDAKSAIKGVNLPTSRERAAEKKRRLEA